MTVLKLICLLIMTIAVNGQYGSYSQKRIERQSPMSMGMKMLGDLRSGMQRTFDGLMSRVRARPNNLRHSSHPNRPPPNHHPSSSVSSPHSRVPFGPSIHRPHFQGNIATKEEFPPAPIFKAATKSSFSVFHEDDLSTRPTISSDDFTYHHPHHNPEENEIHGGNHHSNFMFHGNQAQHLNNFNAGSHRNGFVSDDRDSHFKVSPSAETYAGSNDGWKVIQSPRTPPTFKKKGESYPQSNEIHSTDYRDFENKVKVPFYNLPENTVVITPSPEIKSTHYLENHGDFPAVTLKPYASSSYHSNHNSSPGRPRVPPPQPQKLKNKRPFPQRHPMIAKREPSQQISLRHTKPMLPPRSNNARLISNGYKMEMGPKLNEEGVDVKGYEFGYGVVDESNGNTFYHAEKKKDGTTQGSYKVNLPDGRVQTVNYMANEDGYHPDISFEGKSEFPKPKQ